MNIIKEVTIVMLKKSLYTTLISIIFGLLTIIFINDDAFIYQKITKVGLFFLIMLSSFVLLSFISWIIIYINKKINFSKSMKDKKEEFIQHLYDVVTNFYDSLEPKDRTILDNFLSNGNKPYMEKGNVFHYQGLFTYDLFDTYTEYEDVKDNPTNIDIITGMASMPIKYYKLKQDVYRKFLMVKDKYGSLSKFYNKEHW